MSKTTHRKPREIAYTILKIVQRREVDWTHIYYECGASSATLNKYINRLLRDGLIEPIDRTSDNKRFYQLTSKAVIFIEAYVNWLLASESILEADKEMCVFKEELLSMKEPLLR